MTSLIAEIAPNHRIASREEWLTARKALLTKEKELTRRRDALAAERRALPWVKVAKRYVFRGPEGEVTLADLFDGRSQLFVKHFMLAPGQLGQCVGCSLEVDHLEGLLVHLRNHDVSYVAVARAPIEEIEAVRQRMGWQFPWVSSHGSDFNHDFQVSFKPEELAAGHAVYNYEYGNPGARGPVRRQRLPQGRRRPDLPHILHVPARRRGVPRHLPVPRCHAEGTDGERTLQHARGLGAAEKHLR